jgi:phosphorylcholine metabolism protein LicD
MKIPLQFVQGKIILPAVITSSNYRFGFRKISFLIDTGSPKTFISEKDAMVLQIPMKSLKFSEFIKLGGSKYEMLNGKPVKIYFKNDEGKSKVFDFSLTIAKTTKKTKEAINESRACPSIIGTDFLTQHDLSLFFRPAKSTCYLESK